jgi:hypothetical protein
VAAREQRHRAAIDLGPHSLEASAG